MPRIDLNQAIAQKHPELECIFCGSVLKASTNFYPSGSRNALARADEKGRTRLLACKDCAQNFFRYLKRIFKTPSKALYHFCAALDVYYNEDLIFKLKKADIDNYIEEYFELLGADVTCANKTFTESPIIKLDEEEYERSDANPDGLTEEDSRNRREILTLFHYDPFEDEPLADRRKLYRDLVTMAGPEMVDDLVRQRAAIEIVRSFARIDTWTKTINEMSNDPQKMVRNSKEIKALIDTKNKETDMVTKFSKDHGFAERYATAKSRGAGTLGATIRDMEEFDFDEGKVNLYDIKTSATMQQAADISTQAIMKQLSLSEADYVDMLKQQRERMVNLEQDLMRAKEELRLVYKQITKQDLLKELATELAKKGLNQDEVLKAILAEIHYDDKLVKKLKKEVSND